MNQIVEWVDVEDPKKHLVDCERGDESMIPIPAKIAPKMIANPLIMLFSPFFLSINFFNFLRQILFSRGENENFFQKHLREKESFLYCIAIFNESKDKFERKSAKLSSASCFDSREEEKESTSKACANRMRNHSRSPNNFLLI